MEWKWGSLRERIIIALLIYRFGEELVETEIPITEPEIDVKVNQYPISIKTITGKTLKSIKLRWTVDQEKALEFYKTYTPNSALLLVQMNWSRQGSFFYIPLEVQAEILTQIGRENYIQLPKIRTNSRGIEISPDALQKLTEHKKTFSIPIEWKRSEISLNPYQRWIELWQED